MKALESLFGQSPFAPLQSHMQQVGYCVEALQQLIRSLPQPLELLVAKARQISDLEHLADLSKAQIKKSLLRQLFLPVNREVLLQALAFQDGIADTCERIAHLLSFHPLQMTGPFARSFENYSSASFETFAHARALVYEYDALLSSSFGGCEAERVDLLVEEVAIGQHSCQCKQYELMRQLYAQSSSLSYAEFHLWHSVIEQLAAISFQSEKLVYRMRQMLETR